MNGKKAKLLRRAASGLAAQQEGHNPSEERQYDTKFHTKAFNVVGPDQKLKAIEFPVAHVKLRKGDGRAIYQRMKRQYKGQA